MVGWRYVRIAIIRRRTLLSSITCFTLFFLLIAHQDDKLKKRSYSSATPFLYNLMEETPGLQSEIPPGIECTLDYANKMRLQQDHPCVIELIKRDFLHAPSPENVPLALHNPELADPSAGQTKAVLRLLRNQTNGFFIECGAADGEFLSNTLYLERTMKWSGLLIEPEKASYASMLKRNRKSWTIPVCLSLQNYPTSVSFKATFAVGNIVEEGDSDAIGTEEKIVNVQCFPLYSILLAMGQRRRVDFFSLDIEGHELKVLKTIPFHKIDFRVLAVEWEHIEEGEEELIHFMKLSGFVKFGRVSTTYARDLIFVKDFLRDLRYTEEYDYDYS